MNEEIKSLVQISEDNTKLHSASPKMSKNQSKFIKNFLLIVCLFTSVYALVDKWMISNTKIEGPVAKEKDDCKHGKDEKDCNDQSPEVQMNHFNEKKDSNGTIDETNKTESKLIFDEGNLDHNENTASSYHEAHNIPYHNKTTLLTKIKRTQIESYINGTGLIFNIHITHHAGTTMCHTMRSVGSTPEFACMGGANWPSSIPGIGNWPSGKDADYSDGIINQNETSYLINQTRQYFHYVSLEHREWRPNLHAMNWDDPHLISMIPMRHPIERFLSGGKCGHYNHDFFENEKQVTSEEADKWWDYANSDCADNYALRVLVPTPKCCSKDDMESAKEFLRHVTFIIDQECLDESMVKISEMLNVSDRFKVTSVGGKKKTHVRNRISNDTLWEFLSEKFRYDIGLYEWSKNHSVVRCK